MFTPGIHGELLAETDANGHTTTHSYDSLGRRITSQLPAVPDGGTLRSWRFDRVGNVLGHTDAAGRETTWTYSALNHRESQTDPSPPGTAQAWTYDVAGNVLSHTDRRGIVHTQRYDGENRVIERTRDALRIETLAYDLAGRVLSRTDARNEETRYTYDAGGSPLSETRALGFVQRWTYTPWGGVETQTDADGLTRGHVYDARQRLIEESDPAGKRTTHRYDLADNRTRTTRPGNAEWRYAFDADRKLIEVESPEGHRSVYTHDRHGNRVEQRDAENTRTGFTYDARHRLRAIDHPVGGDESFAYNGEGELTAHTDRAGQAVVIERDGLGRVTERRYGAAETGDVHREVWTLDGNGQPTLLSQYGEPDGPHHVQRRFDGQGRLSQEDDRYSQRSRWTYDEVGNRLSLIDPAGTTTTAPDRLNRIARLSTDAGSTALSYSPASRLQQITHPNGAVSDYTYDDAGRIERITHRQGNTEVARFEYTHDDRGNRREERRIDASGEQITTYDYDRDDRLTEVEVTAPDNSITTTTYTLDAVGNRSREQVRRGSTTVSDTGYTYQAHQRLIQTQDSVSGITTEYTYDARGHLITETTNGQTTTYRPNAQDRLATLTLPGAPPVHYSYDAEGKRVERRTHTDLTRFGWDGPTLRRETNAANNVLEAHDWAAGRILASRSLTDTRYAQHDALRSPIRWSRSTGAEAGQLRYDAWGDTTASATDLPRIAYTGHYREREGSSYYAQQRYYRPGLGRFNRVDPWEGDPLRPVTLNKYLYANGNPLYYTDPTGMYGESGHYYTVLLAAREAGYNVDDSLRIALYAQLPDQVGRFDAINRLTSPVNPSYEVVQRASPRHHSRRGGNHEVRRRVDKDFSVEAIQGGMHVLNGEQARIVTARSRALLVSSESIEDVGTAAHPLGDSFAHRILGAEEYMYGVYSGHTRHLTAPDSPVVRPQLYGEYAETLVMALAESRGGAISKERAASFASGLVSMAEDVQTSLRPRLDPILSELAQARVELDAVSTNGGDSDMLFHRVHRLELQVHRILNSGESAFRSAIAQRAGQMVVVESDGGRAVLRPEEHRLGYFAGAIGYEQSHLDDFFRSAEKTSTDNGQSDLYSRDRDASVVEERVRRYLGRLAGAEGKAQ